MAVLVTVRSSPWVSVKVQVTVSNGSPSAVLILIVALPVARSVVKLLPSVPATVHERFVRDQPAGMPSSDAVYVPAGTLNVLLLGSVTSASSSSEKLSLMAPPSPRLKVKSWALFGTASLTITIRPLRRMALACIWLSRWPTASPSRASNAT